MVLIGGNVRFGSGADICIAKGHVRFAPNNDSESGFREKIMSALLPEADLCGANRHFCFGPIADIAPFTQSPRRHEQVLMGEL
jgi:hypothetical protein